jgi:hypothetical protein
MEKVGIFLDHWYILWPFGNLVAIWDFSPHFGILCQEKSGNSNQQANRDGFDRFLKNMATRRGRFSSF